MSLLKNSKRWLPGALISGGLIVAILYFVDFKSTWAALRSANYAMLALIIPLSIIWMAVRAQVWRTLLRYRPAYGVVFLTVGEGYLLNNFLPFRLGELGRAFLLSRKSDLPFSEILPTIVVERAVDLGFSAAVLLISLPFVVGARGAEKIGLMVGGAVLFALLLLYFLARNQHFALGLFHSVTARWPALQRLGGGFLESFLNGLGILTDGWLFLRFLFWMTFNWGLSVLSYYVMIRAFFPQAQVVWGMFGLGAAAFGGAIPSLPGAVGTFEGAFGGAVTLLTGDQSGALAVALVGRFYNYLNSGLVGGIGLFREGQTIAGIYRQVRQLVKIEE
jgi:hypothetical protein